MRHRQCYTGMHTLKEKGTHFLSDILATFQIMISIRQNLWLYDGHYPMLHGRERTDQ